MAMARPMPEVDPVTSATRPFIGGGSTHSSNRRRSWMPMRLKLGATVASATASTVRAITCRVVGESTTTVADPLHR